jgi:hypothetical protein
MPRSAALQIRDERSSSRIKLLVLRKFNFDLEKALAAQVGLPVGYGSEFQKGKLLLPLLKNHPLWNRMKKMLTHGSQWPTEPITEEDIAADLIEALKFGNHKGATTKPELLLKLVSMDTPSLSPLEKNKRLPVICMAPLNIQPQWTINGQGVIVER